MHDQRMPMLFEPERQPPHPAVVWYGDRTRVRRERNCLSQAGLAHAVGVSQSTISRIENGLMPRASMTTIARIEQTLETVERHRWG